MSDEQSQPPTTSNPINRATGQVKTWKDRIEPWQWAVGFVLGILFGVWSSIAWIRSSARDAVLDERFLGELAAKVRPSCVFDMQGAMITESGISDYIDVGGIKIVKDAPSVTFAITVPAKKHLRFQPLIECINYELHTVEARRTAGHGWLLRIEGHMGFEHTNDVEKLLFKLEILH